MVALGPTTTAESPSAGSASLCTGGYRRGLLVGNGLSPPRHGSDPPLP
ncbi:hypothetical protein STRIP9103_03191 [Streptomyces ipomoeae 91-03]|uniref:Uncharacterized protein n=1 Tax=Streptomyces ipomoeae 91-03 TaxID=698759 RepID=L1L5F1_9ACTN|nr:hypothetical protein STRIP9103_03191 [Streptomyces ipomoeae 91-03]